MDIESFLPINTKEKVDEIINLILEEQMYRNVYTDILVHIQKVKMQLYFKEKFDDIKSKLSYQKESVTINPPIRDNKKKASKQGQPKHALTINSNNINIHFFRGMTIQEISEFIGMPLNTLSSIIRQKKGSSTLFDNSYSLTNQDIELLSDFLQNAYNAKIRKDKKEELLEKEMETAGYYRKKMEDRFKPSLGQEGNYRKLIYIRTKT